MTELEEQFSKSDTLLQSIRYGPMTPESYTEHRINEYPEKKEQLEYLLNKFRFDCKFLYMIVEVEKYYLTSRHNIRLETQFMILQYFPPSYRKIKNIPKFGDAINDGGKHTTIIGERVYLTPPDVDADQYKLEMDAHFERLEELYKYFETDKYGNDIRQLSRLDELKAQTSIESTIKLNNINKKIEEKNTGSKFKIFKLSNFALNIIKDSENRDKNSDDDSENSSKKAFKAVGYVPPGFKRTIERPKNPDNLFSVVVKNIPQSLDTRDAEKDLKAIFLEFGDIHKVKVLRNYDGDQAHKNKGIAFIDFYEEESQQNAIQDRSTKVLLHMVLGVEAKQDKPK
jgi:hypothetical protein